MSVPKRVSRSALKEIGARELDSLALPDSRAKDLRDFAVLTRETSVEMVREMFAGTTLVNNPEKIQFIVSIRNEIRAEWQAARNSFLAIGRALVSAEEKLTSEEFRLLRQETGRLFPFSDGIASQLRQVAKAVDSGRLLEPECPGAYSVAYQITLLNPGELELARKRGLVRPDVTRTEVIRFRQELREENALSNRVALADLRREHQRIVARRREIIEEMSALRRRQHEITRLLGEG
jgi:hypothetical protein